MYDFDVGLNIIGIPVLTLPGHISSHSGVLCWQLQYSGVLKRKNVY